jgi:Zn-dependent peptidase ImmA (M78 family)/transcriptional regulator with XRE-family HTH domain
MTAAISAQINPPLLVWAREESGYELDSVARRLKVKPERLLAWERGDLQPTVRQARELARFYHRPFGVFFLPHPPAILPLAAQYRRLPKVTPGLESPELRLALRTMAQRREAALELSEELGTGFPPFRLVAHLEEGPGEIGRRLRLTLGVAPQEQFAWSSEWEAWRHWREAIEAIGVLVFQFPGVALDEARGVSLLQSPLPAIGINSKESAPGARAFTLLHELVHLALAAGQEEKAALQETRGEAAWREIERFAEEAASAALIPEEALAALLAKSGVERDRWDLVQVRRLAAKFRVTPLAMATRLRAAGQMTWAGYQRWKQAWEEYLQTLSPSKGGFVSPAEKALGRGGQPFARLVIGALDSNRITAVQACRYLDLRFDHVEKLRTFLKARPHSFPAGIDAD